MHTIASAALQIAVTCIVTDITPAVAGIDVALPFCSATEKDVHVDSLAQLLEDEHCGAAGWAGKAKLERAVRNSSALVAAFIKTEELSQLRAAGDFEILAGTSAS